MTNKNWLLCLCVGMSLSAQISFAGTSLEDEPKVSRLSLLPTQTTPLSESLPSPQRYSRWKWFLGGTALVVTTVVCTLGVTQHGSRASGRQAINESQLEIFESQLTSLYELLTKNLSTRASFTQEKINWGRECFSTMYDLAQKEINYLGSLPLNLSDFLRNSTQELANLYQQCDTYFSLKRAPFAGQIMQLINPCAEFLQHPLYSMFKNGSLENET